MEEDVQIIGQLFERIRTFESRYDKTKDIRIKILSEKEEHNKKIKEFALQLFKSEQLGGNFRDLEDFFKNETIILKEKTFYELKALRTIKDVIDHPMHLNKILQLFNALPQDIKKFYDDAMNEIMRSISYSKQVIEELINNANAQYDLINKFQNNNSIVYLLEYLSLFNESKKRLEKEAKEQKSKFQKIKNNSKKFMDFLKTPNQGQVSGFIEKHKSAIACIFLATIMLSYLVPEESGELMKSSSVFGSALPLVRGGLTVVEDTLLVKDIDLSISDIIENYHKK